MVFTEGKNSEPDYVNGLKRLPRIFGKIALKLEIHPEHVVPMRLVELAVDYVDDPEIDECWCIFDVESPQPHPNLKEALALAEKRGVKVAVSNPCFETWLVLHFEDCTRSYTTAQIDRLSKRLDGRSGKSIDADKYLPHREAAAERARKLDERHDRDGKTFPKNNPSSGMPAFLAALDRTT
ncbi:hypothetical protein APASM_6144 [Actinosynnema pretiosum subsp. pretiosum]|nr:hypothetical protein APASM_6144 [Actinosynnema pretiosum subsp. pretiosum]